MNDHELDQENAQRKRADLQRYYPENFVLPAPAKQRADLPATTSHSTVLDVPVHAVEVVSVQTNERDRSAGYLLRTIPLSVAFAIVVVVAAITLADESFLSWLAFATFWISFVAAWMFGEYRHGKSSPNAAALEEIRRKWDNIDANDARRWDAWEKITGITPAKPGALSWLDRYRWYIALWALVSLALMVFVTLIMLAEVQR